MLAWIGPHEIKVQGRETNPRLEIKELYSAIEEAKADVTGLFALQYMMAQAEQGRMQAPLPHGAAVERQLYTTYLASSFRTCASACKTPMPEVWQSSSIICAIRAAIP